MRSQNRKVKIVGKASCLSLLMLLVLATCPVVPISAFAEEDYGIDTQSMTASTVTIAFSPTSASGSMTPVDETNGDKAKVDVQASVRVQNSGGYSVYVGSGSSELKNGANIIKSVEAPSTYADLPINRWGYSFQEGTVAKDSYVAMPATLRSSALYSNPNINIVDETKTFMLSFAARIGADMPAGTYTNSVTMSVVSSPRDVASLLELVNMQDMTSSICSSSKVGDSKQLKDVRDGKYYWVTKLADNNCWMTQNLDLDLSTNPDDNGADTNVVRTFTDIDTDLNGITSWTPTSKTFSIVTADTIFIDNTGQRSWSLGDVRIAKPDEPNDCGYPKNDATDCPEQFTAYVIPQDKNGTKPELGDIVAHYALGNHYQWNAATAGTGGAITSGTATSSICPKGWRLPTSSGGEFTALVAALGGTSSTDNVTKAPFYGVRGGDVWQDVRYLFNHAGDRGYYWSSTPNSSIDRAYFLLFRATSEVIPSGSSATSRQDGYFVRCVAR